MRFRQPALLAFLLVASSCSDGTGAGGPSWFRASLSGEVTGEYTGTGLFSSDRQENGGSRRYFNVYSRGTRADIDESFWFRWPDDQRPRPGTYALVPHTDLHGSPHGVTGLYSWGQGDNVTAPAHSALYVATGGTVAITRSTAGEVEGTVRFVGVQVSKMGPVYPERDDPRYAPDPGAPKVEVSGSFRLKRFDPDDAVVRNTH